MPSRFGEPQQSGEPRFALEQQVVGNSQVPPDPRPCRRLREQTAQAEAPDAGTSRSIPFRELWPPDTVSCASGGGGPVGGGRVPRLIHQPLQVLGGSPSPLRPRPWSEVRGSWKWGKGGGCRLQAEAGLAGLQNHAGPGLGTRGHGATCAKHPQAQGEVEGVQAGGREGDGMWGWVGGGPLRRQATLHPNALALAC